MRIWDSQKMADLVTQQAKLNKELGDVSDSLHQEYHTDGWDSKPEKIEKYSREQMRHSQLTRELEVCNNEINSLEQFRPSTVKEKKNAALTRFLQSGHNGLEADEIKSQNEYENEEAMVMTGPGYERFVITPETDGMSQAMGGANPQMAATRSDNDSGNVLNPQYTRPSVIDALKYYGGISKMAYNFSTGEGNEYRLPYHDEVSAEGNLLSDQASNDTGKDLAKFTFAKFDAHTMSSGSIAITREMLQDSIIDIAGFANARVVRRMGRGWDKAFMTNGTRPKGKGTAAGAPEPTGLLGINTCALIKARTTGTTLKLAHADLVNAIYDVDRAYREGSENGEGGLMAEMGGRTGFLISDEVEKILTTTTDSDGRPLWLPAWTSSIGAMSRAATILGYPYEVGSNLPAMAANSRSWMFGNFSYFGIRTVAAIEIFRFQDSRTMQNNTIQILGFSRRYSRPMVAGSVGADPEASSKFAYLGIPQIVLQKGK